jgi:hypothetical protein
VTLDNVYECTRIDPSTGIATMSCVGGSGTVQIKGNGLVLLQQGKTYRIHLLVDIWHSQHQVEFSEVT